MQNKMGFEIREPTVDYPLTLVIRPLGDASPNNWKSLAGRTLSLPDTTEFGFTVAVQERVEGPECVLSQTVYVPAPLDEGADDYVGRVPGKILEQHRWTAVGDFEIRCVPGVDHEYASWAAPVTPTQQAWMRLQDKVEKLRLKHPEFEIVIRTTALQKIFTTVYNRLEQKYGIRHCRHCIHWDENEGQKEYQKITHRFDGGDVGRMNVDIAAMCAAERRVRSLDEQKVGYCTVRETLIERDFRACQDFEEPRI